LTRKTPAIFLDRDGVINQEVGYVTSLSMLHLCPGVEPAIKQMQLLGYKVLVITNQSAVARGFMTEAALIEINQWLLKHLSLDGLYYCPHYPPGRGVPSTNPFVIDCGCRKPSLGMFTQAIHEHSIELSQSFMVGDRDTDIVAGQNLGVGTVLVDSGIACVEKSKFVHPDIVVANLYEFVKLMCAAELEGENGP